MAAGRTLILSAPARLAHRLRPDRPVRIPRPVRLFRLFRPPRGARRGGGRGIVAGLLAGCLLLLAACGWFGVRLHQEERDAERRQEILAAARRTAVNLTSLDHRSHRRDTEHVLRSATGEFRERFAARAERLAGAAAEHGSVSAGHVLEAGIVRQEGDAAQVLVAADSEVSHAAAPGGEVRHYRLRLDLEYVDGRWLTSRVEFVD